MCASQMAVPAAAPTQSLVQAVMIQVAVNETRKSQLYHDFEQKRKVVNPFCGYVDLRIHALRVSLSQYNNPCPFL